MDSVFTLACPGLQQVVATTLLTDEFGLLATARCEGFRSSVVTPSDSGWCCRRLTRLLLCEYSMIQSTTSVIKANTWIPNRHPSTARQPIRSVRRAFGAWPTNPPATAVNWVLKKGTAFELYITCEVTSVLNMHDYHNSIQVPNANDVPTNVAELRGKFLLHTSTIARNVGPTSTNGMLWSDWYILQKLDRVAYLHTSYLQAAIPITMRENVA